MLTFIKRAAINDVGMRESQERSNEWEVMTKKTLVQVVKAIETPSLVINNFFIKRFYQFEINQQQ